MTPPISMRELVERATPGPWKPYYPSVAAIRGMVQMHAGVRGADGQSVASMGAARRRATEERNANAQLIARLSPSVILQVMDALDRIANRNTPLSGNPHITLADDREDARNCLALLDGKNTEIKTCNTTQKK